MFIITFRVRSADPDLLQHRFHLHVTAGVVGVPHRQMAESVFLIEVHCRGALAVAFKEDPVAAGTARHEPMLADKEGKVTK